VSFDRSIRYKASVALRARITTALRAHQDIIKRRTVVCFKVIETHESLDVVRKPSSLPSAWIQAWRAYAHRQRQLLAAASQFRDGRQRAQIKISFAQWRRVTLRKGAVLTSVSWFERRATK